MKHFLLSLFLGVSLTLTSLVFSHATSEAVPELCVNDAPGRTVAFEKVTTNSADETASEAICLKGLGH